MADFLSEFPAAAASASGAAPPAAASAPDFLSAFPADASGASASSAPSATAQPVVSPAPSGGIVGQVGDAATAFGHHLMNAGYGATQLGAHGISALTHMIAPGSTADQNAQKNVAGFDSDVAQREQQYQATTPNSTGAYIGATAGELLPALVAPEMAGSGFWAKLGGSAALGAGSSAIAPVTDQSQGYGSQKAVQAGIGAATGGLVGGATNALSKIISPNVNPLVQKLIDSGVTPTPGQILGGGFARTEAKATSLPVLGDMIKNSQQRAVNDLNVAAYNEALKPIGQTFSGTVGHDGVQQVQQSISDVYNTVLPKMQLTADPQFISDVSNLGQMAGGLPKAQADQFLKTIQTQIIGKLSPQGTMDGQTLKGVQSELGNISSGYLGDPSYDNKQLGAAIGALRSTVDQTLIRTNPTDLSSALQGANEGWANYARIRAAAGSPGAGSNGGIFTAAQLNSAVRGGDKSAGKGQFAQGNALMQDLSGAGQQVLGSKYPDSGTVGRNVLATLMTGGVGVGGALAPLSTLGTLGGLGAASLPYTKLGNALAAKALTARPAVAAPIGNALSRLAPVVGAGAGAVTPFLAPDPK